jgi:N-formylglutamate deformylase
MFLATPTEPEQVLRVSGPANARAPLVLDSPHSGTVYPPDYRPALAAAQLRGLEDAFVDELFEHAPNAGATLVAAQFPRAYIDPNRAIDDIHTPALADRWPHVSRPTQKALLGVGLVFTRTPEGDPIYAAPLSSAEVSHRIRHYYCVYHQRLRRELAAARTTFGFVWHLNCHSMPSRPGHFASKAKDRRADFCLGDRHGTTCAPEFTDAVAQYLKKLGYSVAINVPYAGIECVRRFGRPASNVHSLQLEINRDLYMDERRHARDDGFNALRANLDSLVNMLASSALSESRRAAE